MRRPNDTYPTPHLIIDALLSRLRWPVQPIWEPCCGNGRLSRALVAAGYKTITHDINTGNDFFAWHETKLPALITNPPFGVIRRFIDHAFVLGVERMALVCPERLWACRRGYEQWNRHRPSRFANLTWREDYLGKGGSPDRALAISIWDTPHSTSCSFEIWNSPRSRKSENT